MLRKRPRAMRLSELSHRATTVVDHVEDHEPTNPTSQRLRELGFVTGEEVRVVAIGPFSGDPLVVQVGFTRFALRRQEAARVCVHAESATQPVAIATPETAPPIKIRETAQTTFCYSRFPAPLTRLHADARFFLLRFHPRITRCPGRQP